MCRGNSRQGAPARMQPLRPSALLEEYLDTRGGAGGDALDSNELVLRQAEQLSRCERGAEMGHNTGRMKARVMKTSLDGRTDSDGRLDADHIGGENIVPRRVELLADGKRGRQPHDARMHDARWMRVVVVQPVHEQPIGESGIARSQAALVSDHGALTGPGGRDDSGKRRSRVGLRMARRARAPRYRARADGLSRALRPAMNSMPRGDRTRQAAQRAVDPRKQFCGVRACGARLTSGLVFFSMPMYTRGNTCEQRS